MLRLLGQAKLREAERDCRFADTKAEYHRIDSHESLPSRHEVYTDTDVTEKSTLPESFTHGSLYSKEYADPTRHIGGNTIGVLRCIFHRSRPPHISGRSDILPFRDGRTLCSIFDSLGLPFAYLQIATGSTASVHSSILYDHDQKPCSFELVLQTQTRQGHWSLALSHKVSNTATSAFWSVDERIDSQSLLGDLRTLQDFALHPMLIPCIMFAETLRAGVERRHAIKDKMRILEESIREIYRRVSQAGDGDPYLLQKWADHTSSIDWLFELLQSCRSAQTSRDGRYHFWQSYHSAIEEGFAYCEMVSTTYHYVEFARVHSELKQWTALTWRQLESIKARDMDHIARIDNISNMLYNLVGLRDSQIQLSVAKATQRDSADMKFIAVLGSVFLPAGLVASVLNIQEFQFVSGGNLFGAYLGITIALIGFVVGLCIFRPQWSRQIRGRQRSPVH